MFQVSRYLSIAGLIALAAVNVGQAQEYADDSLSVTPVLSGSAIANLDGDAEHASDCGGCDACCGDWCDPCDCGPRWVIRAGAVILNRSNPKLTPAPGQTVSNVGDFGWAAGPDLYIARRFNSTDSIEVRYFSARSWTATYDFNNGNDFNGLYTSRLYSTEFNVRRQYSPCVAFLAGFRYIEVHEGFNNQLVAGGFGFNTDTANYMYGGQIGADAVLWARGAFHVEGWAKAGLYSTESRANFFNTAGFDQRVEDDEISFVGDLGFTAAYQLTDHLALRAGYQLLWIEGIAIAGDQLQYNTILPPLPMDTSGGAFYHGAMVGAEFSY